MMDAAQIRKHCQDCLEQFRAGYDVFLNEERAETEEEITEFFAAILQDLLITN
jgi:hypothetical protein